jgi:hypothetical protein
MFLDDASMLKVLSMHEQEEKEEKIIFWWGYWCCSSNIHNAKVLLRQA